MFRLTDICRVQADYDALSMACRQSFRMFITVFFRLKEQKRFIFAPHHEQLIQELVDVFLGKCTYLVINIPPRYGKTELVVKLFTAWCYAVNAKCKFIHLSYSQNLTNDNSDIIREMIRMNDYEKLFSTRLDQRRDSRHMWKTLQGGVFYATSAGGSVTGFGAGDVDEVDADGNYRFSGAILIDDPLKPDDAYSDVIRKAVNNRWNSTIKSRRNTDRTPVIVIMQRLHEDDFTAMLAADEEFQWKIVSMPALIQDEDGERALWPEKHDVEALRKMDATDAYTFASQYMQSPVPLGGGIFKKEWLRFYEKRPALEKVIAVGDTATKTKEVNDYSVFQLWGLARNVIYLLDQVRGKWEAPELLTTATNVMSRWKGSYPQLSKLLIEDKSSGTGLIQTLRRQSRVPIIEIPREKDKVTRAMGGAPFVQSGMVQLPMPETHPFVDEFTAELLSFSASLSHKHDDQVDPMLDAIDELLINKSEVKQKSVKGLY